MENNKNKKENKNTVRVILNVPEELNNTFVELAKKRGLTKSNMIIYSMSWFLDYNKSLDLVPEMINILKDNKNLSNKEM